MAEQLSFSFIDAYHWEFVYTVKGDPDGTPKYNWTARKYIAEQVPGVLESLNKTGRLITNRTLTGWAKKNREDKYMLRLHERVGLNSDGSPRPKKPYIPAIEDWINGGE